MMQTELMKAARKLADAVEFDMNGTIGKGGNGGLLSDTTLRAAHEVQALLSRKDHADDIAVDRFATAMKTKLAKRRSDGMDIWHDKTLCSQGDLSIAMANHMHKGDPVDVANYAMMLHQRGESILPAPEPVAAIAQLNAIVDAWEALPGGRQVRTNDVESWLGRHMAPQINAIRGYLCRPRPGDTTRTSKEAAE